MTSFSNIKTWAEDDRPREKLITRGRRVLSDAELLAILIGSGNKGESAVELARRILSATGSSLAGLAQLSVAELQRFKGIGQAKAVSIVAALELGRRRKETAAGERLQVVTSSDVAELFRPHFLDLCHEEFHLLMLGRKARIIRSVMVGSGGYSATVVDPKLIFRLAFENRATSVVLCHNHPSGDPHPSAEDIELTLKLKRAGELLELYVADHVIVCEKSYYSFADHQWAAAPNLGIVV